MARPRRKAPRSRKTEIAELTVAELSFDDVFGLGVGRLWTRGGNASGPQLGTFGARLATQEDFDDFVASHPAEVAAIRANYQRRVEEGRARSAAYLADRRRQGLDTFVSTLYPPEAPA